MSCECCGQIDLVPKTLHCWLSGSEQLIISFRICSKKEGEPGWWGEGGGLNLLSVFQMREKFESLQTTSAGKKKTKKAPFSRCLRCAETDLLFSTPSVWQRTLHFHLSTLNVHVLMELCGGCCSSLQGEINEFSFSLLRPPASPLRGRGGQVAPPSSTVSFLHFLFLSLSLASSTPPPPLGLVFFFAWDCGCCDMTKCPISLLGSVCSH